MPNPHPDMRGLKRGGSPGRQRGQPNVVTREVRLFCANLISSDEYRQSVLERLRTNKLPPPVEVLLWHYGLGKPAASLEIVGAGPLSLAELIVGGASLEPDDQDEDADVGH